MRQTLGKFWHVRRARVWHSDVLRSSGGPLRKKCTGNRSIERGSPVAVALAGAVLGGPASGCGLEGDPVALAEGRHRLRLSRFAQRDGRGVAGAACRAGSTARSASVCRRRSNSGGTSLRIGAALWQLRARLYEVECAGGDAPSLAIVLIEPMLWSRISPAKGAPELAIHVDGPASGDVVMVTEAVVIAAINVGTLTAGEALGSGFDPALRWR